MFITISQKILLLLDADLPDLCYYII